MSMTTATIPPDREDNVKRMAEYDSGALTVNAAGGREAAGKARGNKDKRDYFKELMVDEIREAEAIEEAEEY